MNLFQNSNLNIYELPEFQSQSRYGLNANLNKLYEYMNVIQSSCIKVLNFLFQNSNLNIYEMNLIQGSNL